VVNLLTDIQQSMYNKAKAYRDEHITPVNTWEEFMETLEKKGGFLSAHWDGTAETEEKDQRPPKQPFVVSHWITLQRKASAS